jgi:hypothetical protein
MTPARLFLIILVIVIIIAVIYLFIRNVGNLGAPLTIGARPLQIITSNQNVLTSTVYNNSSLQFYINYAVFKANNSTANQYFNLVPASSQSPDLIVIQDTASGLYLVMNSYNVTVPPNPGTGTSEYLGTFSTAVSSAASVFRITRGTGNNYQFQLSSGAITGYLAAGTPIYLPPNIITPVPAGTVTAIPLTLVTSSSAATTFSLHS